MYVRGDTAERVFGDVRHLGGPGGEPVAVPRPEHLVAMKVRAIVEAPERTWQDLADIGYLVRLDGVDLGEVQGYFARAGLEERCVSSNVASDTRPLELKTDVPTTAEDIEVLRRLRNDTPSWLQLTPAELDAVLPADALDRRPTTSASATPFELP